MIAQKCFCYVRTDPTLPKHKGISLLIIDMDTPGIDIRPLRHINGTAGFAEVFFTDVIVPRENLVGELNGGWAHHAGFARARARRACGSRASAGSSRPSPGSSSSRANRAAPTTRSSAARSRRSTSSRRRCARSATRASRRSRRARRRPSTRYMKMATSEAGKAAYELGMEIVGPLAPVTDPEFADVGPLVARLLHVVREHDRGRQLRDPAQHHRPARARAPEGTEAHVDFSLTDDQTAAARHRAQAARARVPARARARAHRRPVGVRAAVAAPARVHRARRGPRVRPLPVPRADRLRRPRPVRSSRPRCTRRSTGDDDAPPAPSRSSTTR